MPYGFALDWWFPQLAMLFLIVSVLVGVVARMNEYGDRETHRCGRLRYDEPGDGHIIGRRCLGDQV